MGILPEGTRETNPTELHFEDLNKMAGDAVTFILTWLLEKVQCLCTGPTAGIKVGRLCSFVERVHCCSPSYNS